MRAILTYPGVMSPMALESAMSQVKAWTDAGAKTSVVLGEGMGLRLYDDDWNLIAESGPSAELMAKMDRLMELMTRREIANELSPWWTNSDGSPITRATWENMNERKAAQGLDPLPFEGPADR